MSGNPSYSYANSTYDIMIAVAYAANKTASYSTSVSTTKGSITYALNSSYAVDLLSGSGGSYSSVKCAIITNCKGGTISVSASATYNRQVTALIGIG